MEQTERTIKFVNGVTALVDSGVVKNRTEIIKALGMTKTTFSNVMNGRRNIPPEYFKRFSEVYKINDRNSENYKIQQGNKIQAIAEVVLSALAEIMGHQKGKPVGGILDDLNEAVNARLKRMSDKSE